MHLNIFSFWKSITTPNGRILEYRTHQKNKLYTTTVRDVDSEVVILTSIGVNKENAEKRALSRLSRAKDGEIAYSINSGKPLEQNTTPIVRTDVWNDSQRILSGQHRKTVQEVIN